MGCGNSMSFILLSTGTLEKLGIKSHGVTKLLAEELYRFLDHARPLRTKELENQHAER